jgi:hypothetical protein
MGLISEDKINHQPIDFVAVFLSPVFISEPKKSSFPKETGF